MTPSQPYPDNNICKEIVAPADNQTMLPVSEEEDVEENSDEAGTQQKHPSNVVVVRDGGKVLVPLLSIQSNEKESSGINDSAVATHLHIKDKTVNQSQMAKGNKQPVLAAAAQKGIPSAAAAQAAKKNTQTATSGQKRSSPSRSSHG